MTSPEGRPRPASLSGWDDERIVRLLRHLVRTRQVSGLPLPPGLRKKYVDVIRMLEKRIVAERYS